MTDVALTYGALLLGGLIAFCLSGLVWAQSFIYFKLYPHDSYYWKTMVSTVWTLDTLHSTFICASLIDYFIMFYGKEDRINFIPWTIAFSIVVTAIQTLITHCYFARKLHKSSHQNWLVTGPIMAFAFGRLFAAIVSTYEMGHLRQYSAFTKKYPGWVFTTGLSLSAFVDILITGWLCYYLRSFRRNMGSSKMIHVVDTLTVYTLENGLLTCIATTASLICWLTMNDNLVFLGLHFVIAKLYANSLLASLNTRKELREMQNLMQPWGRNSPSFPVLSECFEPVTPQASQALALLSAVPTDSYTSFSRDNRPLKPRRARTVEVNIARTVERRSDDMESYTSEQTRNYRSPTTPQWGERLP